MANIFISYSRKDSRIAQSLLNDLSQDGHSVFLDTFSIPIGVEWWQEIIDLIKKSDYFLFVDTMHSNKSDFCDCELTYADTLKKTIIPIRSSGDIDQSRKQLLAKYQQYEYNLEDPDRKVHLREKLNKSPISQSSQDVRKPENPHDKIYTFRDEIISQADQIKNLVHQDKLWKKIEARLTNLSLEVQDRYLHVLEEIQNHDMINGELRRKIASLIENIRRELNTNPVPELLSQVKVRAWSSSYDQEVGWLVDDIISGKVIPFLGPGLAPTIYSDKLENMIIDLIWFRCFGSDKLDRIVRRQQIINVVIGLPCSSCHFYVNERPDGQCPMLTGLPPNKDNSDPLYTEQQLSIALNNIRYLADFYLLSEHKRQADFMELRDCLQKCFVPENIIDTDGVFAFFKSLPDKLSGPRGKVFDLMLTTSFIKSSYFSRDGLEFFFEIQEPRSNYSSEEICLWMKQGTTKKLITSFKQFTEKPDDKPWIFDPIKPYFFQKTQNLEQERMPIIVNFHGLPDSSNITEINTSGNQNHPSYPILSRAQFDLLINSINNLLPVDISKAITIRYLLLIGFSRNDLEIQQLVRKLLHYDQVGETNLSNLKIYFVHQEQPNQTPEHQKYEKLSIMAWKSICSQVIFIPVRSMKNFITNLEDLIVKKYRNIP